MVRSLVVIACCCLPAAAQPPGVPGRPSDGTVVTRAELGGLLNRVDRAYSRVPDEAQVARDEPRLRDLLRRIEGRWQVVEMRLNGRTLALAEFDPLGYVFEEGTVRYVDSPARTFVPPLAAVEWRDPEVEAGVTAARESALQEAPGQPRDYEAVRPLMTYADEGRIRLWWWDRFAESLDPSLLYRDPDTRTSVPELQRAIPTEGSLDVTATRLTLRARGVGLRSMLPPKFQGPLRSAGDVVMVLERSRRPAGAPVRAAEFENGAHRGDRPVLAGPRRIALPEQPVSMPGPKRIQFMTEEPKKK